MTTPLTPSVRDIAGQYTNGGISVLPIRCDGSKAPAVGSWKNLQDRIGTAAELDSWFAGNVGIGVIGGQVSGGLEVIDFDRPGKFDQFAVNMVGIDSSLLPRLPKVATPSNGHHVYLRCDEIENNQKLAMSADGKKVLVETRGEKGYVLSPGSPADCHPTGRTYRHIGGPPIQDTPRISSAERKSLLDCARAFDERPAQQPAQQFTPPQKRNGTAPGEDFGARHSWADILVPHGWVQASPNTWRRPGKTSGGASASSQTTSQAGNSLLRVFSSNAHPFESDQSYSKFACYAILQHGGDYSAAAKTLAESGYGDQVANVELVFGGNGQATANPGQPAGTATLAPRPKIEFERITAGELDSGDYSIEYLIDGTLTAGQPMIVAGGKKQLKTNMLLDMGISLATARAFLGRLEVNRATRVAIMSGESGMATIQETCRRICKSKGLELRNINGLIFSSDLPRLDDARYLDALEEFVTDDEIETVILDPIYMMMPGADAGNLFVQGEMLRNLSMRCERLGVTVVLCHHTKKGIVDPYEPPELEHIAWSGFQEFCRQWLLIGRREKYEPGTGEHALWINIGGSAGHSSLWGLNISEGVFRGPGTRSWEVGLLTAEEARDESAEKTQDVKQANKDRQRTVEVNACKESIRKAFNGLPDHRETLTRIKERSGRKGASFDTAFGELIREGELKPAEIIRNNGQAYPGYERIYSPKDVSLGDSAGSLNHPAD
jgi:putative DNA primase/helicase